MEGKGTDQNPTRADYVEYAKTLSAEQQHCRSWGQHRKVAVRQQRVRLEGSRTVYKQIVLQCPCGATQIKLLDPNTGAVVYTYPLKYPEGYLTKDYAKRKLGRISGQQQGWVRAVYLDNIPEITETEES